jgi:hypothetical protein
MPMVRWTRLSWWILGLALVAALAAPEMAAAGRTVTATLGEPFEINGESFGGGELTLREVSSYNPTMTLNEVWVGERCLGLMLADSVQGAAPGSEDRIIFERNDLGRLVLVGFAYRNRTEHEFYNYHVASSGGRWSAPVHPAIGVARN